MVFFKIGTEIIIMLRYQSLPTLLRFPVKQSYISILNSAITRKTVLHTTKNAADTYDEAVKSIMTSFQIDSFDTSLPFLLLLTI